jgi:serine/threonine protein kinase
MSLENKETKEESRLLKEEKFWSQVSSSNFSSASFLGEGSYGKVFSFEGSTKAVKQTQPREMVEYLVTQMIFQVLHKDYNIDPFFININFMDRYLYDIKEQSLFLRSERRQMDLIDYQVDTKSKWCRLFYQLTKALFFCEVAGILHMDVKPENVLLDQDGNAFLSDFGMYQVIPMMNQTKLYHMPYVVQTARYRAPEQFTNIKEVRMKVKQEVKKPMTCSVVWSLSMTLYCKALPQLYTPTLRRVLDRFSFYYFFLFLYLSEENHQMVFPKAKELEELESNMEFTHRILVYFFVLVWSTPKTKHLNFKDFLRVSDNLQYFQDKNQVIPRNTRFFLDWVTLQEDIFTSDYAWTHYVKKYGHGSTLIAFLFPASSSLAIQLQVKNKGIKFPSELHVDESLDVVIRYWIEQCLLFHVDARPTCLDLLNSPLLLRLFTSLESESWGVFWSTTEKKLILPTQQPSNKTHQLHSSKSTTNISKAMTNRLFREYLHLWLLLPNIDPLSQQIRETFMQFLFLFDGRPDIAWLLVDAWFPDNPLHPLPDEVWTTSLQSSSSMFQKEQAIYVLQCTVLRHCWNNNVMSLFSIENLKKWVNFHYKPISRKEFETFIGKNEHIQTRFPFITQVYIAICDLYNQKIPEEIIYAQTAFVLRKTQDNKSNLQFPTDLQQNLTIATDFDVAIVKHIEKASTFSSSSSSSSSSTSSSSSSSSSSTSSFPSSSSSFSSSSTFSSSSSSSSSPPSSSPSSNVSFTLSPLLEFPLLRNGFDAEKIFWNK